MSQGFKEDKATGENAPEVSQPDLEFYNEPRNRQPHGNMNHARNDQPAFIYANAAPSSRPARRVCGLRGTTFFLLLALILVIVLAAALGGGIGSTIVQQKDQQLAEARAEISELKNGKAAPSATKTGSNGVATVTVAPKPTSDCLQHANKNFSNTTSGLSYTRVCGSNLASDAAHQNYFQGYQSTFDACILMCDTYNANLVTRNVTVVNYNFDWLEDEAGNPPGTCWCTGAEDYKIVNYKGYDSAFLVGSFDQGDIP